jgi:hypothetical protein
LATRAASNRKKARHDDNQSNSNRDEVVVSTEKLQQFWQSRDEVFDIHRALLRSTAGNIRSEPFIEKEVPHTFNITKRFEKWQASRQNEFFCELDDLTCLKFFSQMNITFQVAAQIEDEDEHDEHSKSLFMCCFLEVL